MRCPAKGFSLRFSDLKNCAKQCEFTTPSHALTEREAMDLARSLILNAKKGVVYTIGNGGSAGIASHFHLELLKNLKIPSLSLDNSSLLTAIGNDCHFENIYELPLYVLLKKEDLLVAISSSGKSTNILKAVEVAKMRGTPIITASGFSAENPLRKLGDLNIWFNSQDATLVETGHFLLLHTIIDNLVDTV